MAGGNAAAMSAMMQMFGNGGGYQAGGGGGLSSGGETEQEAYYKARLKQGLEDQEHDNLLTRLEYAQWAKQQSVIDEREYAQRNAENLAATVQQIMGKPGEQTGLLNMPGLSPDMIAALQTAAQLGASGNPAIMSNVGKILEQTQNQFLDNAQKPEDLRMAEAIKQNPDILELVKNLKTQPTSGEKYANALGLQGEDRRNFLWDMAHKSSGNTVNVNTGDQGPAVQWMTPEEKIQGGMSPTTPAYYTKGGEIKVPPSGTEGDKKNRQHLDTMTRSLNRLDSLIQSNPTFDPADWTDATLRDIGSDDSSLIGKAIGSLQSPASKAYGTIAKEWVSANRALLSGAAVPEIEFQRDLGIYFAKPGDSAQVQKMKEQMRKDRIRTMNEIVELPPEERAAAWRQQADHDEVLLNGLSTKPGDSIPAIKDANDPEAPAKKAYEGYVAQAKANGKKAAPYEKFRDAFMSQTGAK